MTDNINLVLLWLKAFKNIWLPQNIPEDIHLLESITTKLLELEQLLKENTEDEEELHRAKLLNDNSSNNSDTEQVPIASTSIHELRPENSLLTPPDNHHQLDNENEEQQSRQVLLEQSDSSENQQEKSSSDDDTFLLRPSIRLKRISQADAERYMPSVWKNENSKIFSTSKNSPNSRKNAQEKQLTAASNSDNVASDSNTSLTLTPSKTQNNNHETPSGDEGKIKRKSATSDSDQTSNSSKTNETSTSSISDDDFTIKIRTRKSSSNKIEKSSITTRKHKTNSHKKKEVVISYNSSTVINEPLSDPSLTIAEDISPMDEDINPIDEDRILKDVIENNDNESIFASLDIPQNKPMEINDNNIPEDILNNGIDSSPTEDSNDNRSTINVPSYGHLLAHSKLSSDSDNENLDNNIKKKLSLNDKKQGKNSKRAVPSSPTSDLSPIKKKSKVVNKQRAAVSISSSGDDDSENESTSATRKDASSTSQKQSSLLSNRIQIERSSSEESNDSNEISTKRSKERRKKAVVSDERSNILKRIQRKTNEKKNSKSTTTTDNSDDDKSSSSDHHPKKPKKSKAKSNDDESEESTDDENEEDMSPSKRKHGRKNIRKIIGDKELDAHTKIAIEAERERRQRIAEKQKIYNNTSLDQSYMSNNDDEQINNSNGRLILELDKITNEPLIEVSPKLVEQLKPHQCDGIRFLWNNVFESIDVIQKKKHNGNGCILAHCMGLGKTLQIISFIHTVFNYDTITNVKTCLVLCPINAALNWTNEFEHWLKDVEPPVDHYQLTTVKPNLRVSHLNYWYANGGVVVMGYEMYRRLASGFGIKNKKLKADAFKCLVDPGPDIVVADEGHILKNAQTALAKCLSKIKTPRRIVLTGTPLQNNLIEYFCMVSFIKPSLLGSQQEYINRFVNPIQNGQHRDSNEDDVRLMKRRACVLHELLTGFVDRKDYSLLKEYLPPKYEYIINIRLSDLQSKLYELYLKQQVNQEQRLSVLKKDFHSAKLFADYQYLQKIWTHPFLLYPLFIDRWKKQLNRDDDSMIDDNELEAMFTDDEENIDENKKTKHKKTDEKQSKSEIETDYSGFLIDNIKNETQEIRSTISKTTKPGASTSSTTTLDSDSVEDNDDIIEGVNSDSKSSKSDDDIEIIKSYATRSRTTKNDNQKNQSSKTMNSNVFDTENEQIPPEEFPTNQEENSHEPWLEEMREQFWFPFLDALPEESKFDIELSGKFLLLKFILDKCFEIGDKVLLFSRSLYTLNHIEKFLKNLQIQNEKEYIKQCEARRQLRELLASNGDNDNVTNEQIPEPIEWVRDRDYFRMDGQTEVTTRKRYAKAFNDTSNIRARLFLISTLAGGIGINLTGSNRVIVFDASWNPSHDTQAIFRSYRFGQKKPVYIYRFLAHGTMEEKIYQRQVVKQSMSQRVVDDHQLDRHFTQSDIKELYNFKPERLPEARPASSLLTESNTEFNYAIPKDHLLLDLLYEHNRWVHSYHSHDSLLENKLDEGLTADERRKALEEYENLKRLPDQRQIALQRFHQQQRLNALIAQQQQLASSQATAAQQQSLQRFISEMVRHSLPNINAQPMDYNQILQHVNRMGANREPTNNATKSNHKRVQKPNTNQTTTGGPVHILPRPTNADRNIVIVVESDGETDNNSTSTIPK